MGAAGLCVHPWILYSLLILLSGYVAVDLLANHLDSLPSLRCSPLSSTVLLASDDDGAEPLLCKSLDGHIDSNTTHFPAPAKDPWRQMKWVGEPATCRVKGHLIEKLDAGNNFRRGFALKFTADVEDKTHVLPWLLGTRVDLNARERRVYLDLGANAFSTSISWFLRMYPCDFTEVHAFEVDGNLLRKPAEGFNEDANYASANQWAVMVKQVPGVPEWMLDRVRVHYKFVSDLDDEGSKAINITRFMKEELKLKASDTVVVKMDIEGSEWPILRRWMQDADMASIVDELFVEVHYDHPSMRGYHWARFAPVTREEARALLAELRWRGFFAHAWP